MTHKTMKLVVMTVAISAALAVGGGGGYWFANQHMHPMSGTGESSAKVMYWYDPMKPDQHFDKPGKSPFMDMQLLAKYANSGSDSNAANATSIAVDPSITQNLGVRVVQAERGVLNNNITVTGAIQLNDRLVAVMQARTNGFVERVYARAAGDVISRGAPIADLLVPDWAGAQIEYLAVLKMGDPSLINAARQRLLLLGMPADLITRVEKSGKTQATITLSAPIGGLIQTLDVRSGMTMSAGQTLAKINGLNSVWLEAAVPEAQAGGIRVGSIIAAHLTAYPSDSFHGKVIAVLPDINMESRTLRVRIKLPNPNGQLKPGMFAQIQLQTDKSQDQLLIPEEAVIRTGKRNVVILALAGGHFQPVEVQLGQAANGQVAILSGMQEGQKVVASGQFLIDSEASLQGVLAKMNSSKASASAMMGQEVMPMSMPMPATASAMMPAASTPYYQGVGKIESITPTDITISHHPIPAIGWGAMTMTFKLPDAKLVTGVKVGDQVNFGFNLIKDDYVIAALTKTTGSAMQGNQP
ncbi:MAG: efflux RND transporter periplasmic adaptor subunit [Gammaproteobacteria bacterium]|jgi:Cu(I)/Ag(I) efflux system membrane fusion protein|nr:efflux RND transporter periplasmic adaptor subunit [Gammaproteobacteria bacterium]